MANEVHVMIVKRGAQAWNTWRQTTRDSVDLSWADLRGAKLSGANLAHADLTGVNFSAAKLPDAVFTHADLSMARLSEADLSRASFGWANLSGAFLDQAILIHANLSRADLARANLFGANLFGANLTRAKCCEANLSWATLVETNLVDADLTRADLCGCKIFGASVWRTKTDEAIQENLIITSHDEPTITVDNIEVGQFIHLLLRNNKIRRVIDTITSKLVLILGRFTPDRKEVLDQLRDELRVRGFVPVLFDFDQPESRDVTETVTTLARMAHFIVADLTDPRSIPLELQAIVPQLPSVPVQPLIHASQEPWGMFAHFRRYPWVLEPFSYDSIQQLCEALSEKVIAPAVWKAKELAPR
jgi:hypothetical protein